MLLIQAKLNQGQFTRETEEYVNGPRVYKENGRGGQYVYIIGIIDFLTPFNCDKRMELCWKKTSKCSSSYDCSVQHPNLYANRYLDYFHSRLIA